MNAQLDAPAGAQAPVRIPPQSGRGFRIRKGDILRVVDPLGEQVSDLFAVDAGDHSRSLSSGRTIDYQSKIYLTEGDILWSSDSKPMFTIVRDEVKRHDFLLTPFSRRCSRSSTGMSGAPALHILLGQSPDGVLKMRLEEAPSNRESAKK